VGGRFRELDHRVVRRTDAMIDWHLMLLDRFAGTGDEVLLDRLAGHAALGGVEQTYLQARWAQVRGDLQLARRLIHQALEQLPGHSGFLALARETDAPLPPEAARVSASRRPPQG
jgi:hypothetical protein